MNYKRDMPVFITDASLEIHNIGDFSKYTAPERLSEDIALGFIPDVMDVIYTYALGKNFKDIFTSNPTEGGRSTALMRVGYYAAEAGCSNEEIYALLVNFDDRVGKYKAREDRARRLIDVIERVRIKFPIEGDTEDFDVTDVLDIISFGNQTIEVEWLLPSLLQTGGNMLLVGPPGVGKTQVALNFAYALATGTDCLGYAPDSPRKILFVSAEMGPVDLKVFTDQITGRFSPEERLLLQQNFFVLPLGESMYLNTLKEQQKIKRLVDVYGVDGIIFDSLGSATNKSLTDEEATKSLLDWNDSFRKEMDVFTWFIHHNRKATENNKEPSGLADVYGSQYITARATTVLSLWPVQHGVLKVRELKKRLAAEAPDWYIKRTTGLNFTRTEEAPEPKKLNTSPFKKGNTNGKFQAP
jgi:KaiC/GvpD/RAD55 family RecA-like ATPase